MRSPRWRRKRLHVGAGHLARLLAQGNDIVPIPGTCNPVHLRENCDALAIMLTPQEEIRLRQAAERLPAAGARYTAEGMKGLDA